MRLELVGTQEVALLLGVSRQRVNQLAKSDPTFPEPLAELAAGRIWLKSDVTEWAKNNGRPATDDDTGSAKGQ